MVGGSICVILGLANVSQALSSLKESEKDYFSLIDSDITNGDTSTGQRKIQPLLVVNEPGLYRLIFKSRKSEAEAFQRWVFEEVLPSIRKTGFYGGQPPSSTLNFRDLLLNTDLKLIELRVLALLDENPDGEMNPVAMAAELKISKASLYRAMARLKVLGLIEVKQPKLYSFQRLKLPDFESK